MEAEYRFSSAVFLFEPFDPLFRVEGRAALFLPSPRFVRAARAAWSLLLPGEMVPYEANRLKERPEGRENRGQLRVSRSLVVGYLAATFQPTPANYCLLVMIQAPPSAESPGAASNRRPPAVPRFCSRLRLDQWLAP